MKSFRDAAARSEYGTAVHEAGHIVADLSVGLPIARATIDPAIAGPERAGFVEGMPNVYSCKPLRSFSGVPLRSLTGSIDGRALSRQTCVILYARTVVKATGMAAERLFFPDRSPSVMVAASDLRAEKYLASLFSDPAAFLDHARADAARIMIARRHQVEAVAAALVETQDPVRCGDRRRSLGIPDSGPQAERARRILTARIHSSARGGWAVFRFLSRPSPWSVPRDRLSFGRSGALSFVEWTPASLLDTGPGEIDELSPIGQTVRRHTS
jgi:hypothetical protein